MAESWFPLSAFSSGVVEWGIYILSPKHTHTHTHTSVCTTDKQDI